MTITSETLAILERQPNTRLVKKRKTEQVEKSTSIGDDLGKASLKYLDSSSLHSSKTGSSSKESKKKKNCFLPLIAKCREKRASSPKVWSFDTS